MKRAAETITRLKSQLAEANSHLHVRKIYVHIVDIVDDDDDNDDGYDGGDDDDDNDDDDDDDDNDDNDNDDITFEGEHY